MSSLRDFGHASLQNHGLAPMATECRRFAANRNLANRYLVSIVRKISVAFRFAKVAFFYSFAERKATIKDRTMLNRNLELLIVLIQLNQFLPSFDLFRNSVWIT